MKRRSWVFGCGCLALSACGGAVGANSGVGADLASTRVNTTSSAAVSRAVSAVFQEQGFAVMSRNSNSITFTKPGGRTADVTWSTLGNPNPVMIRPTVSWQSAGSGQMLVACQVQVAQQSTTFGETVRQPALIGKFAYDGMLRDAKRRVEGGR